MPGGLLRLDPLVSQLGLPVQLNPASLPFFAAAALSGWLVVLAWPRRNEPAAPPIISLVLFQGLWALCEAIEAVMLDPSAQTVRHEQDDVMRPAVLRKGGVRRQQDQPDRQHRHRAPHF